MPTHSFSWRSVRRALFQCPLPFETNVCLFFDYSTNLPKEIMGYPDFPIPDQQRSYIPQKDMLTFLELYAQQFNVYDHVKFESYVIRVRPYGDEDQWEIIVRDLPTNTYHTYIFDAVIVCNGHYHTPVIPKYRGRDLYKGQQIHSHNYRCAKPFAGKIYIDEWATNGCHSKH